MEPQEDRAPEDKSASRAVYAQYVNGKITRILTADEAEQTAKRASWGVTGDLNNGGIRFSDRDPGAGRRNFHIVEISADEAKRWRESLVPHQRAR